MFGLPMSTTLIMGSVILFWIVYTIVFYVKTANWAVEDADYAASGDELGIDAQLGTPGPAAESGQI